MKISTQKAKEVGKGGGHVSTNGLSHQDKNRIDKAVSDGRKGK
ncbi:MULTISPECIES: hypothetical protein [unclassified Roseitalea]|nr:MULTISPECIES: hypothetical protein [unclassified Roseitalea]